MHTRQTCGHARIANKSVTQAPRRVREVEREREGGIERERESERERERDRDRGIGNKGVQREGRTEQIGVLGPIL